MLTACVMLREPSLSIRLRRQSLAVPGSSAAVGLSPQRHVYAEVAPTQFCEVYRVTLAEGERHIPDELRGGSIYRDPKVAGRARELSQVPCLDGSAFRLPDVGEDGHC
jgi:hypothetical protein